MAFPLTQYYPNPPHGSSLLPRRMAQHLFLSKIGLLLRDRRLLRSVHNIGILRPALPLHCARLTESEGILSRN